MLSKNGVNCAVFKIYDVQIQIRVCLCMEIAYTSFKYVLNEFTKPNLSVIYVYSVNILFIKLLKNV